MHEAQLDHVAIAQHDRLGVGAAPHEPAQPSPHRAVAPFGRRFHATSLAQRRAARCRLRPPTAADARFAWQKEQLSALEKDVEARIAKLETKRTEYEEWLKRRNAFLAKADEAVVALYAKMRPDAAAPQLATMPEDAAAAILTKLNARAASAILAEMEAARAANLARKMSDLGRKKDDKS